MDLNTWCYTGKGRLTELAKATGASYTFIWQLANARRPTPAALAPAIEKATKGEVMRWDLRPEDWPRLWPALSRRKDAPKPRTASPAQRDAKERA